MDDKLQHYKVKTTQYTFYLTIKTRYSSDKKPYEQVFLIGGTKKGCVSITVMDKGVRSDYYVYDTTRAILPYVEYSTNCSIDGPLHRGEGTRHMMQTLITIIKQCAPHVTRIALDDSSSYSCDGIAYDLKSYSLSMHAKTWYEKYFAAKPENLIEREDHVKRMSTFKQPLSDNFGLSTLFPSMPYIDNGVLMEMKTIIDHIKNQRGSITHLFNEFKAQMKPEFCKHIGPHIETIVRNLYGGQVSRDWVIVITDVSDVTIKSIDPMDKSPPYDDQRGGGGMNRKYFQSHTNFTDEDILDAKPLPKNILTLISGGYMGRNQEDCKIIF